MKTNSGLYSNMEVIERRAKEIFESLSEADRALAQFDYDKAFTTPYRAIRAYWLTCFANTWIVRTQKVKAGNL